MPLTSAWQCEIFRVKYTFISIFLATFHCSSSKVLSLQRENRYIRRVRNLRKIAFWNLSLHHTNDRGCSKTFCHRCTTPTRPLFECVESFVKGLYLLRVFISTVVQLLNDSHILGHLRCSNWKSYSTFIIKVHHYNDMAKMWMQNFIYILMLKCQSCAHKTVHQICRKIS